MTFIPNHKNKTEVNHKDGNSSNNNVNNLEWCTHSENIQHSWDNNLQKVTQKQRECGEKYAKINFKNSHLKLRKAILQYDLQGNFIKEWESMHEAEKILNVNNKDICACCKGKRKTAKGYIWRYAND